MKSRRILMNPTKLRQRHIPQVSILSAFAFLRLLFLASWISPLLSMRLGDTQLFDGVKLLFIQKLRCGVWRTLISAAVPGWFWQSDYASLLLTFSCLYDCRCLVAVKGDGSLAWNLSKFRSLWALMNVLDLLSAE